MILLTFVKCYHGIPRVILERGICLRTSKGRTSHTDFKAFGISIIMCSMVKNHGLFSLKLKVSWRYLAKLSGKLKKGPGFVLHWRLGV